MLLASDFDEESMIQCLCRLRREGVAVGLVGATAGVQTGHFGVSIRPDLSLSQLEQQLPECQLLIFPDGVASNATLLSDPRVHALVTATFDRGGFVAAMSPAVHQVLSSAGVLTPDLTAHFFVQGMAETTDFVDNLLHHLPLSR